MPDLYGFTTFSFCETILTSFQQNNLPEAMPPSDRLDVPFPQGMGIIILRMG